MKMSKSVGPGAEQPIGVASCALSHERRDACGRPIWHKHLGNLDEGLLGQQRISDECTSEYGSTRNVGTPQIFSLHSKTRGQSSRLEHRKSRVAPTEDAEELIEERSVTEWRSQSASFKSSKRLRSLEETQECRRRRAANIKGDRVQRQGVYDKASIRHRMDSYEAEITRLTRENELLKLLLEGSRFTAQDILEIDKWDRNGGGSHHGQVVTPQSSGRRSRDRTPHDETHTSRIDRLASSPRPVPGARAAESIRWAEFVSRSTSPTQSTTVSNDYDHVKNITPVVARGEEMRGGTHLGFPRSLQLNKTAQTPPREAVKNTRASFSDSVRAWRRRLFPALSRGDSTLVVALFDQGCPVDLVHKETRETPLVVACRLGNVDLAGECLRRGALIDPHPGFGQSALQAAVAAGQEACVRLVLETTALSNSDNMVSNHVGPNKETSLHVASRHGHSGIVEILLYHGAGLSSVDKYGNTPLHVAARSGHVDALASLLDAGGDAIIEEKDNRGNSALHVAATYGHASCVQLLLGSAAEPDIPNMDGNTPFALASIGGHLAVTGLIPQYAPAARRVLRRKGHVQMHRLADRGNCATSDALPRPHTRTSSSSTRLDNLEHPSRHLGNRDYSARCARHKQNENGRALSRKPIVPKPALRHDGRYAPSDALAHGSLFDGLQVYVAGDRQPLGSQRGFGPVGELISETSSATAVKPTGYNDQQSSKQSQSSCCDPRALQSIPSEATTAAIQWEDASAAPSTLASNSPRGDLMVSSSRGVDLGEAGSEIPSTLSSPTLTIEDDASTRESMESSEGEADGAMGPWTMPQDQRAHGNNGINFSDGHTVRGNTDEAVRAPEVPVEAETQAGITEHALQDETANEDQRRLECQKSFELSSEESNGLSGRWWVFYSEGYPYYQHEESGHSQWEDPRYHSSGHQQS